jgi:hypothetical protein
MSVVSRDFQETAHMHSIAALALSFVLSLPMPLVPRALVVPDPPEAPTTMNWRKLSQKGVTVEYQAQDRTQAERLLPLLLKGRKTVPDFFHRPFPHAFAIRIYPDRDTLTAYWRDAWHIPDFQPELWMVASGTANMLTILSPAVWKTQAAEHDPSALLDVERLLTHEMVHVFHGQNNPHPDLDGMDDLGWFVEGLAVYVSGQLQEGHMASAQEAIAKGKEPKHLADAWSGRYRYGVSGSILDYIVTTYGRKILDKMLTGATQQDLLQPLGVTEKELLERWRAFVSAGNGQKTPR